MTIIIYNLVHYECQGKASFIYSGKPSSQQAAECGRDSELSDGLDDCVFKYSKNFFIFFIVVTSSWNPIFSCTVIR